MVSLPGGVRQTTAVISYPRYVVQSILASRQGPVASGLSRRVLVLGARNWSSDGSGRGSLLSPSSYRQRRAGAVSVSPLQTTRRWLRNSQWPLATGLTPILGSNSSSNNGSSNSSGSNDPHQQLRIEDFLLERSLTHRPISGNLVRCTIFDSEGNVKVVSGEFKKSELLSRHGLLPRDLRKLDTSQNSLIPSILVRKNSILVNLLHIRALVEADMVILFDTYGSTDSQMQSVFMYDLEGKLRQGAKAMGGLPYEMRALEAILISVVTALDAEMKVHVSMVNNILAQLEDNIDREKLRLLLIQSKKASAFHQKAMLIRDVIEELLETDEDLAGMYLTEKKQGKIRSQDDHSEIEMLLESYYKFCDEIVQTVGNLMSNIKSTEEIANIILDATRNSLMLLELKFSIGTLGLGAGAFVASLYGMNLKNTIEESEIGFWGISAFATILCSIVIIYALKNVRRVQHVNMARSSFTPGAPQLRQHLERVAQFEKSMCGISEYPLTTTTTSTTSNQQQQSSNIQYYLDNARGKVGQAADFATAGYNLGRADAVAAAAAGGDDIKTKNNNINNEAKISWTRYLRLIKARKAFVPPSAQEEKEKARGKQGVSKSDLVRRIIYGKRQQDHQDGQQEEEEEGKIKENDRSRLWTWLAGVEPCTTTYPHKGHLLLHHNNHHNNHYNNNNNHNKARLAIHDIPESAGRDRILHFQRRLNQARARHHKPSSGGSDHFN